MRKIAVAVLDITVVGAVVGAVISSQPASAAPQQSGLTSVGDPWEASGTITTIDDFGFTLAPALNNATFLSATPDAAIYQIVAGGVPDTLMPAWGGRLTDRDITALVAYLRSLEPAASPVAP